MCKIIAFTDMSKINLKKCVNDIGNTLLKTERDGFGYAVSGVKGVFGEKTTSKHFKSRIHNNNWIHLPIIKKRYEKFGLVDALSGAGIFHGRTSTNSEGLVNTHPMQRPSDDGIWHLIHNGVVDDLGEDYSKLTDNDSEDMLFRLMQGIEQVKRGETDNPMEAIETTLEGYFAFACIDPQGLLHIARDGYATLFMAWSETLNTYIIATTEGLVMKLNKMLDAKIGPIDEVEDDVYMVFKGNELIYHKFISPLGFTWYQADKSQASLGRALSPNATTDFSGRSYSRSEIVTRSESHHRPSQDMIAESDWDTESSFDRALAAMGSDDERLDDNEIAYYEYKREVDNMDASYTITDENGTFIKPHEFYKLDPIAQEQCTIIRADGSLVLLDEDVLNRKFGA